MYSAPVMTAVPVSPVLHYDVVVRLQFCFDLLSDYARALRLATYEIVWLFQKPQRSQVRNLVGSYAKEEGHLSDTTLELPFRRARARKLAARKAARKHKKSLKKHHKVNKQ
ncbi:hypothetical protein Y032_0057g2725 [Ancylostoma ceylanicum]|uniref:Uncharacterized protein n=1 Tax=Ancylostoma ceylanicum TaxID=53326 RepID=A0A016U539_9BILA|nr:hypothetical protein Y032_0057g2725 [Ancylostoma ceylanicum]